MHTGQYDSKQLDHFEAVLDAAVDDARRLGISFDTPDEGAVLRSRMAAAIFSGAASGERDPARLRSQALAMVLDQGVRILHVSRSADLPWSDETRRSTSMSVAG